MSRILAFVLALSLVPLAARADSPVTIGPVAAPQVTTTASQAGAAAPTAAPSSTPAPSLVQRLGLAFTHGLSAPAIDIGNGYETSADGHKTLKSQVSFLKSGLGYSFGLGLFPTKEGAHVLNISIPVYANITTQPNVTGVQFTLTTGLIIGFLDGLVGLGYGYDLFHQVGGPESAGLLLGQKNATCGHWLFVMGVPISGLSSVSSMLGLGGQ